MISEWCLQTTIPHHLSHLSSKNENSPFLSTYIFSRRCRKKQWNNGNCPFPKKNITGAIVTIFIKKYSFQLLFQYCPRAHVMGCTSAKDMNARTVVILDVSETSRGDLSHEDSWGHWRYSSFWTSFFMPALWHQLPEQAS